MWGVCIHDIFLHTQILLRLEVVIYIECLHMQHLLRLIGHIYGVSTYATPFKTGSGCIYDTS